MIENLKKGDQIVTSGGIIGKIIKVDSTDNTLGVEIAPNVQVKIARHTVADLLGKPVPHPATRTRPQPDRGSRRVHGQAVPARSKPA